MEVKLKTILSELNKERELSYRKGSVPLTDEIDNTAPLSNTIIERYAFTYFRFFPDTYFKTHFLFLCSSDETHESDSGKVFGIEKFKNGGEYQVSSCHTNLSIT